MAAAFRYAYGTARYALVTFAHLQPGEVLFVSGAAGGVGLAAVDLGRHPRARVIAGVSTPERASTARAHGAHEVVVYGEEDLRQRIRELTAGQGVDNCGPSSAGSRLGAASPKPPGRSPAGRLKASQCFRCGEDRFLFTLRPVGAKRRGRWAVSLQASTRGHASPAPPWPVRGWQPVRHGMLWSSWVPSRSPASHEPCHGLLCLPVP